MPRAVNYAANRRRFLEAKRSKWVPLKETALLPLEKRVVGKALKVVLRNGVGSQRTQENSVNSIRAITKILAEKIAQVPAKMPLKDRKLLLELMQWFQKEHALGGSVLPAKQIAQRMSPGSLSQFARTINSFQIKFMIDNNERWYSKPYQGFEQLLDFQLKHDIFMASSELSLFFHKIEKS